jgi:hypothetical protein
VFNDFSVLFFSPLLFKLTHLLYGFGLGDSGPLALYAYIHARSLCAVIPGSYMEFSLIPNTAMMSFFLSL